MKVIKPMIIVLSVAFLLFMASNTKLVVRKWWFISTKRGAFNLSSSKAKTYFNEFKSVSGALVFLRNKKINSFKNYQAWNSPKDFNNEIVLACKVEKMIGFVNMVYIDVDFDKIKYNENQEKANNFLPNLMTVCMANSLKKKTVNISEREIEKLINLGQGIITLK